MTTTSIHGVLNLLDNPPAGIKFYLSGSRAVAKRIGTDQLTDELMQEAEEFRQEALNDPTHSKTTPPKKLVTAYKWIGKKPIIIKPQTDFDYFCQDTPSVRILLDKIGFYATWYSADGVDQYRDDLCTAVFMHEEHNIQVVLRSDALLYKAIFDNIPSEIYHDFLWKSSPTKPNRDMIKFWFDTFAAIAKAVQELK